MVGAMIDTYNQQVQYDVACTITTKINTANNHFIVEEMKNNDEIIQVGNIVDDTNIGFKNPQRGRVYSSDGISPALNCCEGGGLEPKIIEQNQNEEKNMSVNDNIVTELMCVEDFYANRDARIYTDYAPSCRAERSGLKVVEPQYRIRKLTPRECFRLMGVDDADIDKIQASGISNSQQYKMAGNSIVVDVLYHIFRKMFVESNSEEAQLQLF